AAQQERRTTSRVDRTALLQCAVAVGQRRIFREQLGEVRAAVLLLAFDEEADTDGQLAVYRAVRLNGLDAKQEMSFVVVRAARPDRAIAHRRLIRSALPQLERHGRLHGVVLHADERALPAARPSADQD